MAAVLQAEALIGAGAFSDSLLLVSGAICFIRTLQHLRIAASSSATEAAAHLDEQAPGSLGQRQPPQRSPSPQDQPQRDDVADPSPPPPAQTPVALLHPPHPQRPPTLTLLLTERGGAPWHLQPGDPASCSAARDCDSDSDSDKAPPPKDARPPRSPSPAAAAAAAAADAAAAPPGDHPEPHRHPSPLDCSWEELAARHASAIAGETMRLSSSSSSSSSAAATASSSRVSYSALSDESSSSSPAPLLQPPCVPLYRLPGPVLPPPPSAAPVLPMQQQQQQLQQLPAPRMQTSRHCHRRLPAPHCCPHRCHHQLVRHQRDGRAVATPPQLLRGSGLGGGVDGFTSAARCGAALQPGMPPPPLPPPLRMAVLASRRRGAPGEARRVEGEQVEALAARKGAGGGPGGTPQWLEVATAIAGAVSRTAAQVTIHPLDTLKTRMQVRLQTPQLEVWRAVMTCTATRKRAMAAWIGAAGVRDLMLGLSAAVAGVLPSSALYFAAEPRIRAHLAQALCADGESPGCRLTASAAAATLSALIRVPADVVKHRVQAYSHPSTTAAASAILATHGPAGFYAGFGVTLLRDAPEIVLQFTVYRCLTALLEQWRQRQSRGVTAEAAAAAAAADGCGGRNVGAGRGGGGGGSGGGGGGFFEHLLLGGTAGAAAALTTMPLDVIKTQMQCGAASSVPAAVVQVVRGGGLAALFGGLGPRLMQTSLSSALFFMCFEASKAQLNDLAATAAAASVTAAPATPAAATATVVAASAAAAWEVAAALKPPPQGLPLPLLPPQGLPLPLLPPQRQHQLRFGRHLGRRHGSAAAPTAAAPTRMDVWEPSPWAAGGVLEPVALYAYAVAGATAPAAAVALENDGRSH